MRNELLRSFAHLMAMGDGLGLRSLLADGAQVFDPTLGFLGEADLAEFAAQWRDRTGGREARLIETTCGDEACVAEWAFPVEGHVGLAQLPVAAVVEDDASGRFTAVRLYHTCWPLSGTHEPIEPTVTCDDKARLPDDVVGRYYRSLAEGDAAAIAELFESSATVREPSGGEWVHTGRDAITRYYESLFSAGGGISARVCRVVDDGTKCAVEYVIEQWGGADVTPQAGVAVYERADSESLRSARVYDDAVAPQS